MIYRIIENCLLLTIGTLG